MSTSSQRESTDSIDDEHSSERAANDSIVYTIFNLLISFSLHFVCFFPIKSWHLQCCQKLLLEKEKKTLPFHALVKTLDYSVSVFYWKIFFLFYFLNRYFSQDVVTCVLVCVCNSLTYLRLAISAGLMLFWQYWGCVCLKNILFYLFYAFFFLSRTDIVNEPILISVTKF